MADIVINEISQNYSYVIGDSSYCCVALPITACWGPAYQGFESAQEGETKDDVLENIVWTRFRANSQGLESFVSTYRGAAANYRLSQDYSYQMAVSLLTAGYDVLVCRLCPGTEASSMLRRSYVGTIAGDWYSQVDTYVNTLELPVKEDTEASSNLESIPFVVDSEHLLTVSSTNPKFRGSSISSVVDKVTADMATGVYALKPFESVDVSDQEYEYTGTDIAKPHSGSTRITFLDTSDASLHTLFANYAGNYTVKNISKVEYRPSSDGAWSTLTAGTDYVPISLSPAIDLLPNGPTIPYTYAEGSALRITCSYSYDAYSTDGTVTTVGSIVYHVKDAASRQDWSSAGIVANDALTYTGDKVLQTIDGSGSFTVTAKYPGTFGNRLQCSLRRMNTVGISYWNFIVYVVDTSGVRVAVENLNFVFDIENSTDHIPFIEEVESQFVTLKAINLDENSQFTGSTSGPQKDKLTIVFSSGSDKAPFVSGVNHEGAKAALKDAMDYAAERFNTQVFDVAASTDTYTQQDVVQKQTITIPAEYPVSSISSCVYYDTRIADSGGVTLEVGTDYSIDAATKTITFLSGSSHVPAGLDANGNKVVVSYIVAAHQESNITYVNMLCQLYSNFSDAPLDDTTAQTYKYLEWLFTNCLDIYDLLNDKLAYNPNRVISPGWDDQNFLRITGDETYPFNITTPSPIHLKLMEIAYYSRCATAYIDLPRSLSKKYVSDESQNQDQRGYAQLLARQDLSGTDGLFTTHSALFGPWGTYMYVGTNKQSIASPGFLALLIQRSMILNQALQYEWVQPSSRKNNVNIGKMQYTVSKKYLDIWQPDPDTDGGVGVNAIANIPDLGLSIWGDSTLYENPPATYQALRNLSTRLLVNAIKNVVYKVGISITFQYTNQTAFSSFYVGVTPILDSMKNAGAIDDYKVVIGNDFDAVGMVKANSCVGKIYITPNGTIQHITVDLIALPPQTDLSNYS